MPENKKPAEPLDDATLKSIVGGASDADIEQICQDPPPPPPVTTSGDGTGN